MNLIILNGRREEKRNFFTVSWHWRIWEFGNYLSKQKFQNLDLDFFLEFPRKPV